MPTRRGHSLVRVGAVLAVVVMLAGCTPGGQFDPTELLSTDMFGTKKKLQGDRQALFPNGVPGAETGVPPDLVKGYQPPPEQAADNADAAAAAAAAATPTPKPKPKPKIARAPATHDAVFDQKPKSAAPKNAGQSAWPAPPASNAAQSGQSAWPAPPPSNAAQSGQSVWPAPSQAAPAQQTAQPGQSVWPNPPPPGTFSH